jgi:hypothetical protein
MLPYSKRSGHSMWRIALLAMVVLMGLAALISCDDSDSDSLTPPPATVISASESPAVGAPQDVKSAPPQPAQPAPTEAKGDYPTQVVATPTPWVYPTK